MKIFHCDHCENLVFFENVKCVSCEHPLAYLPDLGVVGSLDLADDGLWYSPIPRSEGRGYRLCQNYTEHNVCNWAVDANDDNPYCLSCRLTQVIPDLDVPGQKEAWFKVEVAKRRLIYSLLCLGLPVKSKVEDPDGGLEFRFLADPTDPEEPKVLTGHDHGLITLNIAEADDAERESRRVQMHEPYRTLLGHFRHEIGHYYWERLIEPSDQLEGYRAMFGDERADYGESLKIHYEKGAPDDWQDRFISSYASSHSWEDWAETWAHYLHMTDALETARQCGLSLRPRRADEPAMRSEIATDGCRPRSFEQMVERWFPLTYVLNNLNRGLGLPDGYPFVLSTPVLDKLRFIHDCVGQASAVVVA